METKVVTWSCLLLCHLRSVSVIHIRDLVHLMELPFHVLPFVVPTFSSVLWLWLSLCKGCHNYSSVDLLSFRRGYSVNWFFQAVHMSYHFAIHKVCIYHFCCRLGSKPTISCTYLSLFTVTTSGSKFYIQRHFSIVSTYTAIKCCGLYPESPYHCRRDQCSYSSICSLYFDLYLFEIGHKHLLIWRWVAAVFG